MRRYSIFYFVGQSVKGLWRNGVMTLASIMVLMSCLVVMGSFALLVLNINLNLNSLDMLNEIVVSIDTSIVAQTGGETASQEETTPPEVLTVTELPVIDVTSETALSVLDIEKQVVLLDNFTDITQAYSSVKSIEERLPAVQASIEAIAEPTERANQQIYYNHVIEAFNSVAHRISSIAALEMEIKQLPGVVSAVFNSKAAGLELMKAKYSDYSSLFNNLKANPLPDQFIITYNDNSKVNTLKYQLDTMDPMMYKVSVYTDIANYIANIKHGVILIFTWFLAILFVVSVSIIINTIKLAVFSRRQEISIMRYVGATNWFITLPFIFEGVIIGLVASAIAFLIQFYMYVYVQNMIFETLSMISLLIFNEIKIPVLLGFAGVGILTGIIGSGVSLRKYLSV
ncbi:MAG: permease-like cell division protein FtsX [Eubacteriales bacterium]